MQERETSVEQYLRRQVEARGGRCVKFDPESYRGWPDRIVLLPHGQLVWVETKRPEGGRVSSAQFVAHEDLRRLGQTVIVADSRDDVDELLELMIGVRGYVPMQVEQMPRKRKKAQA